MLSILRRQAVLLEKELLEDRQKLEVLKRKQEEHDAIVKTKDERIAELEDELSKRRPMYERILCVACGKSAEEEEGEEEKKEEEKKEPEVNTDAVLKKLEELKRKLMSTETKLTSAELAKSLLELQLETRTSKVKREMTRDLDGAKAAAKAAADKAAKELRAARATERKLSDELAAQEVAMAELRSGSKRRDEQIEFLMQVHDASQECEWISVVPDGAPASPGNASGGAAANAASSPSSLVRGAGGSPFAAVRHINSGLSVASATSILSSGGSGSPAVQQGFAEAMAALSPWQCSTCTLRNDATRTMCDACGSDRFK